MGTRSLTVVIHKGKPVIAQMGLYNGGFSRSGLPVKHWITNGVSSTFKRNLAKCKFISDNDVDMLYDKMGSSAYFTALGIDQTEQFNKMYPTLARSTGCEILNILSEKIPYSPIKLIDNYDFGLDGLFCEYAYVIDLDKSTLGVYVGFIAKKWNTTINGLWASCKGTNANYMPIGLIKEFSFSELSLIDDAEYVKMLEKLEK